MRQERGIAFMVTMSIVGALLLLTIAFQAPSPSVQVPFLDRLFVGGMFISSSALGLALAIRPGWFRRSAHASDRPFSRTRGKENMVRRRGHHPDCGLFSHHVIKIRNRALCAACTGLATGSVAAMFLASLYIINPVDLDVHASSFLLYTGIFLVVVNLADLILPSRNPTVHTILNALLVIAFLSVVIGMLAITGALVYGFFAVIISFLWLDTRVQLSNWRHTLICMKCAWSCKAY